MFKCLPLSLGPGSHHGTGRQAGGAAVSKRGVRPPLPHWRERTEWSGPTLRGPASWMLLFPPPKLGWDHPHHLLEGSSLLASPSQAIGPLKRPCHSGPRRAVSAPQQEPRARCGHLSSGYTTSGPSAPSACSFFQLPARWRTPKCSPRSSSQTSSRNPSGDSMPNPTDQDIQEARGDQEQREQTKEPDYGCAGLSVLGPDAQRQVFLSAPFSLNPN